MSERLPVILRRPPRVSWLFSRACAGRVLGVCFDEKTGVELNEKMVKEGEAVAYVAYSKACVGLVLCALRSLAVGGHVMSTHLI